MTCVREFAPDREGPRMHNQRLRTTEARRRSLHHAIAGLVDSIQLDEKCVRQEGTADETAGSPTSVCRLPYDGVRLEKRA
jgi:hypothetical protein